ncbi:MAG: 23S rRNA (guanosine(2251)-2'-O)-methyltransferase RlmB [Firmicutes bacterium]|nr:23S rRNA (guanosine(2251)-2'-O)-methyltransferase RlmB [Bacillota bacterium]MBQ1430801.1 23S rRNA (guanosine(2251)-2'-O)-methyltransferase RlmB [Bacillota bacterium]
MTKSAKNTRETRPARGERGTRTAKAQRDLDEVRETNTNLIIGRNSVNEALKAGREIDRILVSSEEGSMKVLIAKAKERGIPVMKSERQALDRISQGQPHQGVAAYVSSYSYASVEDILEKAADKGEDPFLIVLDGIEDPHNLGAIIRTADCAGAHGIIIPKRHSAGLTDTVAKASAGAIEYVPVAKVSNIAQTLESLKEKGIWVYACDMDGENYTDQNMKGGLALVIGSEGFGISRLVKEKCDFTVSIPMRGHVNSLNASNAACCVMYEVRRQRDLG